MQYKRKTTDAIRILRRRYIDGNQQRERSLQEERKRARVHRKEPTHA
jgi:hypothetical protein